MVAGCGDCCRHRGTACSRLASSLQRAADLQGMLLFGPPGTGKTLIARQIGKMLNGKEPKVGVSTPVHRFAAHLRCILPLSLSLSIQAVMMKGIGCSGQDSRE